MTAPSNSGPTRSAPNQSIKGIVSMMLAMASFIFSDVFSKLATETLPVGEVIALRGLFSTIMFAIPVMIFGYWHFLTSRMSKPWLIRIGGEMLAAVTFVSALAHMPLANVVTITQSIPLAMTAVGAIFLGEQVGLRRWTATIVGFLGVLLIIRPGAADFSWWSLAALTTVIGVIARDIATRGMDKSVPPILITATTAAGVAISGSMLGLFEASWSWPPFGVLIYIILGALAVASGYYFSIIAVQQAPLSTVAPFRYTIIPMSLVAGYLVWGDRPALISLVGIVVIAGAGLYTFMRERQLARGKT